jgi:uncharacterized protein YciW
MAGGGMSAAWLLEAAGVAPSPAMAEALAARASVFEMTGAARESVLRPRAPGGLSHAFRAALAARVARIHGEAALAERYAAALEGTTNGAEPGVAALADPEVSADDPHAAAMLAHADAVSRAPREASEADIDALRAAGVSEADIVRLSQLVAFLAYECRLVAGLRLMGGV